MRRAISNINEIKAYSPKRKRNKSPNTNTENDFIPTQKSYIRSEDFSNDPRTSNILSKIFHNRNLSLYN